MLLILRKLTCYRLLLLSCLLPTIVILSSCTTTPTNKSESPKHDEAYVIQSVQYMHAGKLEAALVSIKKALEFNPNSADAYTVAGLIYNRNNQPVLAERYYKRALSIDPNHSAAQTNYASFLCRHDKPLEAEKIFLAAAKNNKNRQPDVAYTNAGLCVLGIPDLVKASNYFTHALQINPKSPIPLYQLAKIQYSSYKYQKALQFLQQYEKIARSTPKTLLLGAQIGEAINDRKMADQYKVLLAQQFPNSAEAKQIISGSSPSVDQLPVTNDAREYLQDDVVN